VVVDFVSPAFNIYGFEYEPGTDEEKSFAAEQNATLASPDLLALNDEAGCNLVDDVEPEFVVEGSHAEITTSWLFACTSPEDIQALDMTALFDAFPELLDVDAQWVSPSAQSAAELSPSSSVLRFQE